jgi:multiple sugar transport system substrate-binding protein
MKSFILSFLLVLSTTFVFSSGQNDLMSEKDDGVTQLRFTTWTSNETQLDLFRSMAEEFNQTQSEFEINLDIDSIPFGDYVPKVTLQLSGSNPPDIGWLVESSAPTFVNAGVLEDLSTELEKYDFEDFSPGAMGLWEKDNKVYGVPFSTSPLIIIYNKTLFNQAGIPTPSELAANGQWTWEKFKEVSKILKEKTGVYGFQGMDGAGYAGRVWHTLVPIIRGYGSDAWDQNGKVLINSPEAVKAVTLFHNMVYRDSSVVPPGDLSDFYAGNAAMTTGQISRVSKLKDVTWEWDIAPLPQGPAGQTESHTIGQAAVVSFSAGKNNDAANGFVAFMTNKENVQKMAQYWPPARKSVMESEEFIGGNPDISQTSMEVGVVPGLKEGRVLPYHERFPQIALAASGEFDKLWNKNADIQAVLNSLAEAINSQIK